MVLRMLRIRLFQMRMRRFASSTVPMLLVNLSPLRWMLRSHLVDNRSVLVLEQAGDSGEVDHVPSEEEWPVGEDEEVHAVLVVKGEKDSLDVLRKI